MLLTADADEDPAQARLQPRPFRSAEEAWFWTMRAIVARREGRRPLVSESRPCRPDDILKCLDQLYRHRRIDLLHARILRIWGERQTTPNPAYSRERCDWRIWREAISRLEWPLRAKGFVVS